MMPDMADASRAERFEDAHPPLMVEMTTEDGSTVQVPRHRLPRLLYWHVLVRPFVPPKKAGSIYLPDQVAEANDYHVPVFQVIGIGPLAFKHPRLRGGDARGWRQELPSDVVGKTDWHEREEKELADDQQLPQLDDWVLIKRHAGQAYKVDGCEIRLINDDDIIGVIDSPTGWASYVG